jgi:hypothetical protein
MKNLFLINEDERSRILNLHETATKNQYLTEKEVENRISKLTESDLSRIITRVINEQKPDNFMPGQPDNPMRVRPEQSAASTSQQNPGSTPTGNVGKVQSVVSAASTSQQKQRIQQPSGYGVDYIKQAQKLLGVVDDGKFGPKTLEALKTKLGVLSTTQSSPTTGTPPITTTQAGTPQAGAPQAGAPQAGAPQGTTGTEVPSPSSRFDD